MAKKFKTYIEAIDHLDKVDQSDFDQLSLDNDGWTIAHDLATTGKLLPRYITPEILKISYNEGWTVAHELASRGKLPEKFMTPEILRIADPINNWTVAHELALNDNLMEKFITTEILKLARTDTGWTVAHELADKNKLPEKFMTPEILLLKSDKGYVYEKLPKYKNLTLDSAKDDVDLYIVAMTKHKYPKTSFERFKNLTNKYGLDKMKQMVKLTGEK